MIDIKKTTFRSCYFLFCFLFSFFFLSLQILPSFVEVVRALFLVTFPSVYFLKGAKADDEIWVAIGVVLFFIVLGVFAFFSLGRTGQQNQGCLEKLTRYGVASLSLPKRVQVRIRKYCERCLMTILHGVERKAEFQIVNILIF